MKYRIFENNPWQENTVILYDETGEAAIVDCGCFTPQEEQRVKLFLDSEKLTPVLLIDTHLHPDHVFGNNFLLDTYGLSAKASKEDEPLLEHAVEYAAMLGLKGTVAPPPLGGYLKDGDVIRFGHSVMEVIAVPGHSPGGLCFYSKADKLLVAGDVLFAGSIGRADLPGGNGATLVASIKSRLMVLPEDVTVITGHGPKTTIGEEKRYNPFL